MTETPNELCIKTNEKVMEVTCESGLRKCVGHLILPLMELLFLSNGNEPAKGGSVN